MVAALCVLDTMIFVTLISNLDDVLLSILICGKIDRIFKIYWAQKILDLKIDAILEFPGFLAKISKNWIFSLEVYQIILKSIFL